MCGPTVVPPIAVNKAAEQLLRDQHETQHDGIREEFPQMGKRKWVTVNDAGVIILLLYFFMWGEL